ncbi:MAG: hypothetical protein ACKVQC_07135 [Elusimicrobiota bacterium]
MKGLSKVRGEMALTVFGYLPTICVAGNLKRAMKILGVPRLIEAVS